MQVVVVFVASMYIPVFFREYPHDVRIVSLEKIDHDGTVFSRMWNRSCFRHDFQVSKGPIFCQSKIPTIVHQEHIEYRNITYDRIYKWPYHRSVIYIITVEMWHFMVKHHIFHGTAVIAARHSQRRHRLSGTAAVGQESWGGGQSSWGNYGYNPQWWFSID